MNNIYPSFVIKNNKIYRNDNLINLNFEGMKEIKGDYLLYRYYLGNTNIRSVEFPDLISIISSGGLFDAFVRCTEITSISFPKLQIIYNYGMAEIFSGCNKITEITFPELISIDDHGLYSAFSSCTGITSVSFPKLTSIGSNGLYYAFYRCTGITGSVSFPKLTSIGSNGLTNAFNGCTGITELHFRADMQSTIGSNKYGATNATVYFDL